MYYDDDWSILTSGQNIDNCVLMLSSANFLRPHSATLFSSWTKEYQLELYVKVDDMKNPTKNDPKLLRVTIEKTALLPSEYDCPKAALGIETKKSCSKHTRVLRRRPARRT